MWGFVEEGSERERNIKQESKERKKERKEEERKTSASIGIGATGRF